MSLTILLVGGGIFAQYSFAEPEETIIIIEEIVQKTENGKAVVEKRNVEAKFYPVSGPSLKDCQKVFGGLTYMKPPNSKIMPELQKTIDLGGKMVCLTVGVMYTVPPSANPYDTHVGLEGVLYNYDTTKKFILDNGGILEKGRMEIRDVVHPYNLHYGASVPASLVSELVKMDEVKILGPYGYVTARPLLTFNPITPNVQLGIDKGEKIIPLSIGLNHMITKVMPYGQMVVSSRYMTADEQAASQEPIIEFLNNNNIPIKSVSHWINTVHADVPSQLVHQIAKLPNVNHVGRTDVIITSYDINTTEKNEDTVDKRITLSNTNNVILNATITDDITILDITSKTITLKSVPIPPDAIGKNIDVILNGVKIDDYEIRKEGEQTIILFSPPESLQKTDKNKETIQENLEKVNKETTESVPKYESPRKQMKSGILSQDVTCRDGTELFIKSSNGNALCLTENTAKVLLKRGVII